MTETPTTDDFETTAISNDYKIRGEDDLPNGAGVLGTNTATSGTPIGVEGTVPNESTGYGLATPDDARINGVLDTESAFSVNINGNGNLYVQADADDGTAGNVVLGHSSNNTAADTLVFAEGATIAGGGFDDGTTSQPNVVLDNFGTVSGGRNNQAGSNDGNTTTAIYATVGGGVGNTASGEQSTVGGGNQNTASALDSTVGGGNQNTASTQRATVAGGSANTASGVTSVVGGGAVNTASGDGSTVPGGSYSAAEASSSFVWNDGSAYHPIPNTGGDGLSSNTAVNGEPVKGQNTFSVSAQGGVRFITSGSSVTYIDGGTTGWANTSSRASKTNIDPVDTQEVLAGVEELEVATWEYEDDDGEGAGTTHIGPMAEDFHEILDDDVGSSDEHINSLNADGVLFAAVQGLAAKLDEETAEVDEQQAEIDDQQAELEAKNRRIEELETAREDLRAETERLRERLEAVENHLDIERAVESAPADD